MEDIAPQLIQAVTDEFHRLYDGSSKVQTLLAKVKKGTATYAEAQEYAIEVSRLIGVAYEKHISSATLPDGKMYYNIAERLIPETLDENYALVSQYAAEVQAQLNQNAKIGLKVQKAELEQDRIDGLVDLASNAERYDDVSEQLLTAFENFSQHIVDETVRKNADFHHKSGLSPKIIRKSHGKCCDWCKDLVGEYDYPLEDNKVYQRHASCRCTVLYDPADGRKKLQDVHEKTWTKQENSVKVKVKEAVYHRPVTKQLRNSELPNGLPIQYTPDAIVDKTDDQGAVLQRRIYGPDGKAAIDYDTTNHGMPTVHPTGAHKHKFDYSQKNPHGPPLPLDEQELQDNRDIIRKGDNYHDPK